MTDIPAGAARSDSGRREGSPPPRRAGGWSRPAVVVAILAAALGLRLAALTQEPLWADEQYTLNTAGRPGLAEVLAASRSDDPHPPLYFLALHGWMRLAGGSDAAVRLPSVMAGLAAVGLLMLVAGRLRPGSFGRVATAGALAALSPILIYYSQEARGYALLVALELLTFWGVISLWQEELRLRRWVHAATVALGGLASMATHHFGFFVCAWAGTCLVFLIIGRRGSGPWPEAAALILLVLGAALSLARALSDLRRGHGLAWLPEDMAPTDLLDILMAQIGGPIHAVVPQPLAWSAVAVVSLLLLLGTSLTLWMRKDDPARAGEGMVLLAAGFLFAAPVAYSFLATPIIWYGNRYLIVATPILLLFLTGTWRFRWLRPLLLTALALHLACAAFYLHDHYRYRQKRPWDLAAALVDSRATTGDRFSVVPARMAPLLQRYMNAELPYVDDGALFAGTGPARVWLLATGDLRREISSRTAYRVEEVEVFRSRGPGAIYMHLLIRR